MTAPSNNPGEGGRRLRSRNDRFEQATYRLWSTVRGCDRLAPRLWLLALTPPQRMTGCAQANFRSAGAILDGAGPQIVRRLHLNADIQYTIRIGWRPCVCGRACACTTNTLVPNMAADALEWQQGTRAAAPSQSFSLKRGSAGSSHCLLH